MFKSPTMRRNYTMGMGDQGGGGGPLMNDNLQDLELELELLKRKRQLIQQQQSQTLHQPNAGQTALNQPRQSFENRFDASPRRDFSHLYEACPRESRDTSPLAPKRRPVPVWDTTPAVPNKRPWPGQSPPSRLMENKPLFQPPRPAQLPSLQGTNSLMYFAHIPQTKFKGNVQPPGPSISNLSPKSPTTSKTSSAPIAPKSGSAMYVLTKDCNPYSKIAGRLASACGVIFREMTAAHTSAEHVALFGKLPLAQVMRQGIRERLYTAMLGKVVGSSANILEEYRKAFPPSMDADILKLTEVEKVDHLKSEIAIKLLEEDDPELYFKKNLTKLIEVKLDEMFQKAEKSYNDANRPAKAEVVENLPEVKKSPTDESLKVDAEPIFSRFGPIEIAEKHPNEQEYDKWMSLLVERNLPQLLAKHKDKIIQLLDLDQMYLTTKAAIVMKTKNRTRKERHRTTYSKFFASLSDEPDTVPALPRIMPYFARVLASPAMPKRKLMNKFLNRFHPKSIKYHKGNTNLLFVGFNNKEDYDRILEADQTNIGNAKLVVLGCAPKTEPLAVIDIKEEDIDNLDRVLTPQLDAQINDLLSSIKEADEEASDGTNGEATADVSTKEIGTIKSEASV